MWLDIPELVKAAEETAATGATEFCIVAAVRGPGIRLMNQIKSAIDRINETVEINIACSLGMLTERQVDQLAAWGVHRYNHNLETARSYFPEVVTTHSYEERLETCAMVKAAGMELCCGALIGMGESLEQRAELAAQLAALEPHEVPLKFLNPRPGTPLENQGIMDGKDALRAIAAFRLAMPTTVPGRPARRHQRGHRRELPHHAGPPRRLRPEPAGRTEHAHQGIPEITMNEVLNSRATAPSAAAG
ncbi:MAG: biotin synthase [Actinomycetota bacterium]|nr:biotin synthase [Actinomycetota bacterium]